MIKTIILNGPASSGKDVIADYLVSKYNSETTLVVKMMFKEKLIEAAVLSSGVTREDWGRHYERDLKETPWDKLVVSGKELSPRQYLIHMSENVLKKLFGVDVFGRAAAQEMKGSDNCNKDIVCIFSDSGFIEELYPVYEQCPDCFLARIHREGKTFEGDSRNYIYPDFIRGDMQADFINDSTIEECAENIWSEVIQKEM